MLKIWKNHFCAHILATYYFWVRWCVGSTKGQFFLLPNNKLRPNVKKWGFGRSLANTHSNQNQIMSILIYSQEYSRLRCLLILKVLVICFYLGWSGSTLPIRTNIIKVGSKLWLLTCSSDITLSLPSYIGSDWERELNFYKGYLSLLYFCLQSMIMVSNTMCR